jgi:HAD superfamily hydrolase (TIGR01490 family)
MVSPAATSGRVAAFFDVDRTLVRGSSLLALAGALRRAGLLSRRAALRAAVRGLQFSTRGFSDEEITVAVEAVGAVVLGMDAAEVRRVSDEAIPRVVAPRVYDEAWRLIAWHRRRGHLVFLVSASPHELIDKLGEIVNADGVVASEAEVVGGVYTGKVDLCHGAAKAAGLRRLAAEHGIDLSRSYAYGDSIGDVSMFEAVGHAIAVNPDRRLRSLAGRRGWKQRHFRHRTLVARIAGLRRVDVTAQAVPVNEPGVAEPPPVADAVPADSAGLMSDPEPTPPHRGDLDHPGLCASCRHGRRVSGARSRFWLCELSASDSRFPRYPRLPVLRCAGYRPGGAGAG